MASNNNLCMREEEMQTAASGFERCATDLGNIGASMPSKFSGAINSGMMGNTVGAISKEMNLISASLANMKTIVNRHSNQMFSYDREMAKMASEIEIPTDFLENNSMEVNTYNRTLLGKIDGKSVNEGQAATVFNEIADSDVTSKGLTDISGDQTKEQKYDETSVVNRSVLANLVKDETQESKYDDGSSVQGQSMSNISGDQTQEQTYDESSSVQGQSMSNISGDQTQEQTYDSSSSVQGGSMSNINSGNEAGKSTYDETTVVNRSVLGGMNIEGSGNVKTSDVETSVAGASLTSVDTSKKSNKDVQDDMMVATQGMATASLASMAASTQNQETTEQIEEAIRRVDERYLNETSVSTDDKDDKKDHQ